ncbi:MAG: YqaE/Pmp3 family membrane protein [Bacteroidota bacterium]|nr:YqaE/Pmp3 family membrane protein [Bacteroidota bacterium]
MKTSTMQYQKYLSYLIFTIFLNSCTTWHYTNYGKPFDFLKAQRVSYKTQSLSHKYEAQSTPRTANMASKKINSLEQERPYNISDRAISKSRLKRENSISFNSLEDSQFKLQKEVKHIKNKQKVMNAITKKVQNRIEKEIAKTSAITSINNTKPVNKLEEITDFVLLLLCLIFPPVAVWWVFDTNKEFWIDLMCYLPFFVFRAFNFSLFILFVLPVLYAMYVIFLN